MHLRRLRVSTAGHREEQGVNQCLVLPRLGRAAQADAGRGFGVRRCAPPWI